MLGQRTSWSLQRLSIKTTQFSQLKQKNTQAVVYLMTTGVREKYLKLSFSLLTLGGGFFALREPVSGK